MAVTKEDLLNILKHLSNEDFDEFKWYLQQQQRDSLKTFPSIPVSQLENAARTDTVDRMTETYVSDTARVTEIILKKMGKRDLLEKIIRTPVSIPPDPALTKDPTETKTEGGSVAKLKSLRSEFVEKVSDAVLKQLLDRLFEQNIINFQEMESIEAKPRADKARSVVDTVIKKGESAAAFLIKVFCELDPVSDLSTKLS